MTDPRGLNHAIASERYDDGVEMGVYRASAVGYCEWALLAARMGMEPAAPPENMQKVFDEGHDNEPVILDLVFQEHKYLTRLPVPELVTIGIGETIVVEGHIDSLASHAPRQVILIEAKAVGKSLWAEFQKAKDTCTITGDPERLMGERVFDMLDGLWQKYRDQVEVYMAAVGASDCLFAVGKKPERVEGEESRGAVEEISVVWLQPDIARLARIKAKIATVEARARAGHALPAECDQQVYPCPYFFLMHPKKQEVAPRVIENDDLAAALAEFHAAGQAEKDAKARKVSAGKVIDSFLAAVKEKPLLGESATDIAPAVAGEKIKAGAWLVELIERNQPASNRKAYTQRFWQVKPEGGK